MNILGWELSLTKKERSLTQVPFGGRGWISLVQEPFAGAFQRNVSINHDLCVSYFAVFACITLIASDIGKLPLRFLEREERKKKKPEEAKATGIWIERPSPGYDPVLRNPNQFQNRIQFVENWIQSKLMWGNTYVLKAKDGRNQVSRMWVLDPARVKVLVSESGDVFYDLSEDNISGLRQQLVAPASAIIHDRMNALWHPLVGLSPIYAAGLSAMQGLAIQQSATKLFTNQSVPGGFLTTPNTIPDETAARLKREWESRYGPDGTAVGGTAILGDGLEYKPMALSAQNTQMLEFAKATAEWVCSAFHVPPYKIGVGAAPSYNNVQALNLEYYSQCLQSLIEAMEEALVNGLEMKPGTKVEFDVENLLRMDTVSQITSIRDAVGAGVMAPNEGRAKLDLPPVPGGDTPYLQEQNFSLEALNKRDTQEDPFAAGKNPPPAAGGPPGQQGATDDKPKPKPPAESAERDFLRGFHAFA